MHQLASLLIYFCRERTVPHPFNGLNEGQSSITATRETYNEIANEPVSFSKWILLIKSVINTNANQHLSKSVIGKQECAS